MRSVSSKTCLVVPVQNVHSPAGRLRALRQPLQQKQDAWVARRQREKRAKEPRRAVAPISSSPLSKMSPSCTSVVLPPVHTARPPSEPMTPASWRARIVCQNTRRDSTLKRRKRTADGSHTRLCEVSVQVADGDDAAGGGDSRRRDEARRRWRGGGSSALRAGRGGDEDEEKRAQGGAAGQERASLSRVSCGPQMRVQSAAA